MWRVCLLLAGCGRIDFDAIALFGDAPHDVLHDVPGNAIPGLIHYWPLDETTGALTARDTINGFDATLVSPAAFTAGHIANGLASNAGGFASAAMPGDMAGVGALTVSAWLRRDVLNGKEQFGEEFLGTPYTDELSIQLWNDGLVYFCVASACGTVASNDTSWHLATLVFDGSQPDPTKITGYLDGVVQSLALGGTLSATTPPRIDLHFDLGATTHNEGQDSGTIDDVRVYDHAFTAAEVASLFQGS